MYSIDKFFKMHVNEAVNGAHFCPRLSHSRPLWVYYPTKRFPQITFEVEEDIFPVLVKPNIHVLAKGRRLDTGEIITGDLIQRPMLTFATWTEFENNSWYQHYIGLYYWCIEIFNQDGKFTIDRNIYEILKAEDITNGRSVRELYIYRQ